MATKKDERVAALKDERPEMARLADEGVRWAIRRLAEIDGELEHLGAQIPEPQPPKEPS